MPFSVLVESALNMQDLSLHVIIYTLSIAGRVTPDITTS